MLLRSIIIDDEKRGIKTLKTIIEEFLEDIIVVAYTTKASEALQLVENYRPEVVFLDIDMPEMTGFDLLEKLSWRNFNLIFVTAHEEYALKALKNNAVDYILKPVDYEDIEIALEKVRKRIQENSISGSFENYLKLLDQIKYYNKNKIIINLKSGIEAIDINEILYLESESNYTKIHLTNARVLIVSKTLKEFDEQLCIPTLNFMRVHYSFIINLTKVVRYLKTGETIVVEGDQKVPLSKSKKEAFYSWMNLPK